MPLRAAPGEKLGAAACAARTKRNAQPVLQTPVARPTGRLPALQTHNPRRSLAAEALATPEGPFGHLCV
jgi:hypothetical protein